VYTVHRYTIKPVILATIYFNAEVYYITLAPLILAFLLAELLILIITLVIFVTCYFHEGAEVVKYAK